MIKITKRKSESVKTKKFSGEQYKLDWEVVGSDQKTWADIRKQELKEEGYKVRVQKTKKSYKIGKIHGKITIHRIYKRKKK